LTTQQDLENRNLARTLAILGLPGAGKGTQASMIAKRLGYATIAIGELIRRRIDAGGPAGAELARHVGSGALVPNELTLALVKSSLDTSHRDRVLFDGIPRTAEQAVELDQLRRVDLAIHLEVPSSSRPNAWPAEGSAMRTAISLLS
jgi:adenylate kinase